MDLYVFASKLEELGNEFKLSDEECDGLYDQLQEAIKKPFSDPIHDVIKISDFMSRDGNLGFQCGPLPITVTTFMTVTSCSIRYRVISTMVATATAFLDKLSWDFDMSIVMTANQYRGVRVMFSDAEKIEVERLAPTAVAYPLGYLILKGSDEAALLKLNGFHIMDADKVLENTFYTP